MSKKLTLRITVNMAWGCDNKKTVEEHLESFSKQISEQLLRSEDVPSDVEIEVTNAPEVKAYRVVQDEPVGVAVGFKPEGEISDAYQLVHDSGGEFVFIDDDNEVSILDNFYNHPEQFAEPDLIVWRSSVEFADWKRDLET